MNDKALNQAKSLASINSFDLKNLTPNQLAVIKATVAKGATDEELQLFLYICDRQGLDPLIKEIWFIKLAKKQKMPNGNWDYPRLPNGDVDYSNVDPTIMTSIDGYRKKAMENPDFAHCQSMEVRENDEFEMEFDGEKMHVKFHRWKAKDRGQIIGAWACAYYKSGFRDWNFIEFAEYQQTFKDKQGNLIATGSWGKNPTAMIKNRAEAPLLKKAGKVSGIYTEEELTNVIEGEVLDNSPQKIEVRATEIEKIIKQIEDVQTMEEWKEFNKEISKISKGFLKEEKDQIMEAAKKKVDSLKAPKDPIKEAKDEINTQENKAYQEVKDDQVEKDLKRQTTIPNS